MRKVIVILLSVILLSGCLQAVAQQPDLRELLVGYEWDVPATPPAVPGADEQFMAIAADDTLPAYVRARATAMLTHYPSDRVWRFLEERLISEDRVTRRRTVDAMCNTFKSIRAGELESVLIPLLEATDSHLRVRSASCLNRLNLAGSRRALVDYQLNPKTDWELEAAGLKAVDGTSR